MICIWDPDTGELRNKLVAHSNAATITCFQHDEVKVVSGAGGMLTLWNLRDATVVKNLITGVTSVWKVAFDGRWCAAASNRDDNTMLDIWDFSNDSDWVEDPSDRLDEDTEDED
jgi:F-box and WD-40 domain protein CDC4